MPLSIAQLMSGMDQGQLAGGMASPAAATTTTTPSATTGVAPPQQTIASLANPSNIVGVETPRSNVQWGSFEQQYQWLQNQASREANGDGNQDSFGGAVHVGQAFDPYSLDQGGWGTLAQRRYAPDLANLGFTGRVGDDNNQMTPEFRQWIDSNGYTLRPGQGEVNSSLAGLFDRDGNNIGQFRDHTDDDTWMLLPIIAFGGAVAAGVGAGGGAGAEGGLSGMDLAADSAVGGNSIEGAAASFGEAGVSGGGGFGGEALESGGSGLGSEGATNPSLIESYSGTPGYGASSVNPTGAVTGAEGGAGVSAADAGAMSSGAGLGGAGGAGAGGSTGVLGTGLSGQQIAQIGSSLYGMYQGTQLQHAAAASDPFAQYRAGYAEQLQRLMNDPSSVTKDPGYAAAMAAAEQALTRNMAAQGLTGSGTAAEALASFGGKFQNQYWQQQIQTLAGLGGANINNAGLALQGLAAGDNTVNRSIENLIKIWQTAGSGSGNNGSSTASWLTTLFGG